MAGQNKNKNITNEKSKSAKFLLFHFDINKDLEMIRNNKLRVFIEILA